VTSHTRAYLFRACLAALGVASLSLAAAGGGCGTDADGGGGGGSGGGTGGSGGGAGGGTGNGSSCVLPGPGASACSASSSLPALDTELFIGGLDRPVYATPLPGTDDMIVVEQPGTIRRVHDGALAATSFLDVDVAYDTYEQGLLSVAFHPDYLENGRFFVAYTSPGPDVENVVAEYRVSADPFVADPNEVDRLMHVPDPETNHNGGMLAFGADGYLYASLGDTGDDTQCGESPGCAQDTTELFGKILRFDVDAAEDDYIAPCAPFELPEGRPEVWFYGLRNPWRFSFDRLTGDMYVGDVGQNDVEEVSFVPAGTAGGVNFGWRGYEGFDEYAPEIAELVVEHHEPVVTQAHAGEPGASEQAVRDVACIIGGYVYRGSAIPELQGYYFFGDCVSNDIAVFRMCDGEVTDLQRVLEGETFSLASFAEDADGELYLVSGAGSIRRIVAAP
jgi:glucose/arabinose dehydrogenase